jgi:hypothetical protein
MSSADTGFLIFSFLAEALFFFGLYVICKTHNSSINRPFMPSKANCLGEEIGLDAGTCSSTSNKYFNLLVGLYLSYSIFLLAFLIYKAASA